MAQGQGDGANHGDQQDQTRQLEQKEILIIYDETQGLGVVSVLWDRLRQLRGGAVGAFPGAIGHDELHQDDQADQQGQRHILRHLGLEGRKVHIQHHHHKEEQYRDGPYVNDDQQHGDEFRPQQHKQPGRRDKGQDQPQHRMHRLAADHSEQPAGDGADGEEVEGKNAHVSSSFLSAITPCANSSARFMAGMPAKTDICPIVSTISCFFAPASTAWRTV